MVGIQERVIVVRMRYAFYGRWMWHPHDKTTPLSFYHLGLVMVPSQIEKFTTPQL